MIERGKALIERTENGISNRHSKSPASRERVEDFDLIEIALNEVRNLVGGGRSNGWIRSCV